ncbi:FAD/NAD(P)-binding domain-containing protein [Clathrospora elynae]|uniref:FAD/NAD(P)-binding domain-containing protein n=1 Tax=Clathrospora elynae TaxID=706981 RepID=A0A6A5S7E6_9PLEO|nr:FAD/NAD(P)-binding domain-containing protein [Clathrospora elynae]
MSACMFVRDDLGRHVSTRKALVYGTATKVGPESRDITIKSDGQEEIKTFNFHALVIATGASTPSPLLGLNTNSAALRETWIEFRNALPATRSIVISGGGPAGVEVAGELGEYLNGRTGWFSSSALSNPKVFITLITSGAELLPALRPSIARTAEQYLAKIGITIIKNTRVDSVSPPDTGRTFFSLTSKATLTLSSSSVLEADLYIPATGTAPNTSFLAHIPNLLTSSGHITTNPQTLRVTLETAYPRIYAIGDCSTFF